jgi:hypothetical protein
MLQSPVIFKVKRIIFDHEDDSTEKHYLGKRKEKWSISTFCKSICNGPGIERNKDK